MDIQSKTCANCGSEELYTRKVGSAGGYGPALLAGLGSCWRPAMFHVVLCSNCGRCDFYADEKAARKGFYGFGLEEGFVVVVRRFYCAITWHRDLIAPDGQSATGA